MSNTLAVQEAPTKEDTLERMRAKLSEFVPDVELQLKAELAYRINVLKRQLNAVILGHNYMEPALFHSVPDYVGDSLELSRISAKTDADIIVFCGVQFMAETAKILNPQKTVLIPSEKAGCSLASGVTVADVRALKSLYPDVPVVSYVNTYADVKAVSDYCCTSGNAAGVVRHLLGKGHQHIIFLPDQYLAHNTAKEVGIPFVIANTEKAVDLPERALIGWHARCEVHELFTTNDVTSVRQQFPDVAIVAHPEVSPEVLELCDASGSTKQMIDYVRKTTADRYLLLTECSMGDNIAAENPDKEMLRLCSHRCPHMGQITLEDTLDALEKIQYKVHLSDELIQAARTPIDRMLEIR
ncbi:MAG: quinolinate synthase NadA [Candidatus Hydrogenedentes bacterium]|nr:quinolinate synthase NadA [Candidatus Hydrogenedentota bacterium]